MAWIATSECFSSIWTKKSSRIYWFAHMISMKKTKGSVLEHYTGEILGGVIAVIGAIYTLAVRQIKFHWDDIKNKFEL